jgi:hypothetical protein
MVGQNSKLADRPAVYSTRPRPRVAADRCLETDHFLRDLAFVYRATQTVRRSMKCTRWAVGSCGPMSLLSEEKCS